PNHDNSFVGEDAPTNIGNQQPPAALNVFAGASLKFDNTVSGDPSRVSSAPTNFYSSEFILAGGDDDPNSNNINLFGMDTMTATDGGNLRLANARAAGGFTLFTRGNNLGTDNKVHFDSNQPSPVNGVVPWAYGDNSATGGGSDLVTYDGS